MVKCGIIFSSVELQRKYVIEDLSLVCYGRSIHRNINGLTIKITPWEVLSRLYYEKPKGMFSWVKRKKLYKEMERLKALTLC